MNKLVIDPHFCSREEIKELQEYLTENSWDWQEIIPKEVPSGHHFATILLHNIEWWTENFDSSTLSEIEKEHIQYCIGEGICEGELNREDGSRGWWKINKNE